MQHADHSNAPSYDLGLEQKAHATSNEGAALFEEFMSTFSQFREDNDRRLQELEMRGTTDVVTAEKIGRIEMHLDSLMEQQIRSRRPALESSLTDNDEAEVSQAFLSYVRKGRTDELENLGKKGLSVGSEADGGFLVSPEVDRQLAKRMELESPVRSIAKAITISTAVFKKPYVKSGASAGWVAETTSRPETNTPQLAELAFPAMELYAMPAATKQLLDDAAFDAENWLAGELDTAFAEQESQAFVSGDGLASPKGFLSYPRQKSTNPDSGKIGYLSTGVNGAFSSVAPADVLFDLVHGLPQKYRRNGTFVMNRLTLSTVRRMKDGDGQYIFQPKLSDGLEYSLLGYPMIECDNMPEIASGSASIAFGDFKRGYLIVDRMGTQILRDPYSAKPYVLFYATKRVGGGVADSAAIRLLTFAA